MNKPKLLFSFANDNIAAMTMYKQITLGGGGQISPLRFLRERREIKLDD